ncbi:hypothetical protein [Paenibacillus sp. yr247]|nr:hypothetical protein [Paenibacillus sp. yr247]
MEITRIIELPVNESLITHIKRLPRERPAALLALTGSILEVT